MAHCEDNEREIIRIESEWSAKQGESGRFPDSGSTMDKSPGKLWLLLEQHLLLLTALLLPRKKLLCSRWLEQRRRDKTCVIPVRRLRPTLMKSTPMTGEAVHKRNIVMAGIE